MKAVILRQLGGPENLVLEETADPMPGQGEVAVEVAAAGLNFIDTYHRTGLYPVDLPLIPGLEGAGTVTALGEGVDDLQVGDRIAWVDVPGSYAERHVVPADKAIPVPESIPDDIAAALMLQGITAHYLAVDTFPLSPGDRCLIHAGAGGVGLLLTQIAKLRGAEVAATVGSAEKADLSRDAGADVVVRYDQTDFGESIEAEWGPRPLDVVYDGVGAETFSRGLDLLRPRGMMVTFGNASGPPPEISPLILSQKGSLFLTRPTMFHYIQTRDELLSRVRDLYDWVEAGKLEVRIGKRFLLSRADEAHRALEGRATTGKVLLEP